MRVVRRLAKGADDEARNADFAQPAKNKSVFAHVRTRECSWMRRACRSYSPTTRRAREFTASPRAAAAPLVTARAIVIRVRVYGRVTSSTVSFDARSCW